MKYRVNEAKRIIGTILTILLVAAIVGFSVFCYKRTGTFIPTEELFDGRPTFRFVDVGQGDCTLVTYGGKAVLVDAGPTSSAASTAEYVSIYSPKVDYFIITHPHEDHMGGAVEVLERVRVKYLVMSSVTSDENFYLETVECAKRCGVEIIYVTDTVTFVADGICAEVKVNYGFESADGNDQSLFVKLTAGSTSCLISGDAEAVSEEHAIRNFSADFLDADIMKAGHHGSSSSNSEAFLRAVSPKICVISCGRNNTYGHPSSEVTERLRTLKIDVRRTDLDGDVVIRGEK